MKIIAFADVHYFAGDLESAIFNTKRKLVSYALPMLDRITEKINNEYKPDLAVNLGDIIQDTTKHDEDLEALSFMFERLKKINCPCYSLLGNHDLKMMDSVDEVEALLGYKTTHSFDLDGWHLVFLTTEVRPELGTERGGCYKAQYLSDKDLKWLKSDLKKNSLPTVVFTHYTLPEDETLSDECMLMKNRDKVKKILKTKGNVMAVFSGHRHITKTLEEDGIKHYLIGSPIADYELKGYPDGVYMEIDLDKKDVKVTVHTIDYRELSV